MKTKTFGTTTYIVKAYIIDNSEIVEVKYETWINKDRAIQDCEEKKRIYGKNNVFIYEAKQCMII